MEEDDDFDEEGTDVTVEVDELTRIDVRPNDLDYTDNIEVGELIEEDDSDYQHLELSNTGSVPIEEIHAEATYPTQNPFGTGEPSNYDAGNFVTLHTELAQDAEYSDDLNIEGVDDPHVVNRMEWAEDTAPTFIETEEAEEVETEDDETTSLTETEIGRIREGNLEYYWVLQHDGTNADDWVLRIGDAPHTPQSEGTTDFRNDPQRTEQSYTEYTNVGTENDDGDNIDDNYQNINDHEVIWFDTEAETYGDIVDSGVATCSNGQDCQERAYDLFVYGDDTDVEENPGHMMRTRFNINPNLVHSDYDDVGRTTGAALDPIQSSDSESNPLEPGENFPVEVGIHVPLGVPSDAGLQSGEVTFFATPESQGVEDAEQ